MCNLTGDSNSRHLEQAQGADIYISTQNRTIPLAELGLPHEVHQQFIEAVRHKLDFGS